MIPDQNQFATWAVVLVLVLGSAVAARAAPTAAAEAGAVLHFGTPLTIPATELTALHATEADPLASGNRLHLYVQAGRVRTSGAVRLTAPYCRVDIDPAALPGPAPSDEEHTDRQVSGPDLVIDAAPLPGNPSDYAETGEATGDTRRVRVVESAWASTEPGKHAARPRGRSLQFHFASTGGHAVTAVLCAKAGATPPTAEDVALAFGKLATLRRASALAAMSREVGPPSGPQPGCAFPDAAPGIGGVGEATKLAPTRTPAVAPEVPKTRTPHVRDELDDILDD